MEITALPTRVSNSFFHAFCPNPKVMYDLGDIYAEMNAIFFDGVLPVLKSVSKKDSNGETRTKYPTLKWDGRMKAKTLGTYRPSAKRGSGTISLSPAIAKDPTLTRSVLLHEMLHKYLDLKGLDDGIKGHGENFILESTRINKLCESKGKEYRVMFYDEEITKDDPSFFVEMVGEEMTVMRDLDVARKMASIFRAAFDEKFEYRQ
jgi:hypothetical protein